MLTASQLLDLYYLSMRERLLSLAADLDRLQQIQTDPRLQELHLAIQILLEPLSGRAERVQELLSDHTPPPR